jgi:hypothetical protein
MKCRDCMVPILMERTVTYEGGSSEHLYYLWCRGEKDTPPHEVKEWDSCENIILPIVTRYIKGNFGDFTYGGKR